MATGITSGKYVDVSLSPTKGISLKETRDYMDSFIRRLYHADNIDVLHILLSDKSVCGKVSLIYIDPPYNTGGAFENSESQLAYNDKFATKEYLEFMKVRLEMMHQLLSPSGSLYVHIDSNMLFHMKILIDSIFGEKNFRGMITRKKCKSKNFTRKTYGNVSDYILFYGKTENVVWNRPYEAWTEEKKLKEYPFIEETTGRRYKKVPCHAPGVRNGATGEAWRGMLPPKGKHWQYTPQKLDELDAKGEIYWSSTGNPRRKVYLDQSKGIPVQDIWLDFLDVNNQNTLLTGYPTEKNIEMLDRIIKTSSNPGDIVLDCFAGSGTTLVSAEGLGRQWIGVDIGKISIQTIQERFDGVYDKQLPKQDGSLEELSLFPEYQLMERLPQNQCTTYQLYEYD